MSGEPNVTNNPVAVSKNAIDVAAPIPVPCRVLPLEVQGNWTPGVFICHIEPVLEVIVAVSLVHVSVLVPFEVVKVKCGVILVDFVVAPAVLEPSATKPPAGISTAAAMLATRSIRDFTVLSFLVEHS